MFRFLTRALSSRTPLVRLARRRFQPALERLETREVPAAVQIADIFRGPDGSNPTELESMDNPRRVGQILFFTADDGISGRELWKLDPANSRTPVRVKDIYPGGLGSSPQELTVVPKGINGIERLYFTADDGIHGRELWESDGTQAGTRLVRDINFGFESSNPAELTAFKGSLYFAATDTLNGRELWRAVRRLPQGRSNASLVRDINPGGADSSPAYLTITQTQLFFQANNGVVGAEFWSSAGTRRTTNLVLDIRPGVDSSSPFNLTRVGKDNTAVRDVIFFGARTDTHGAELWRSARNPSNNRFVTHLVEDINQGVADSLEESPTALMTQFQGKLYFAATDGTIFGRELWRSNGTEANTFLVRDINPGLADSSPTAQDHPLPERRALIVKNASGQDRLLFFGANDVFFGGELWVTNGKTGTSGSFQVKDINVGTESSLPQNLLRGIVARNRIYFAANDGQAFNHELWTSFGTLPSTLLVKDINPGSGASLPNEFESTHNKRFGKPGFSHFTNPLPFFVADDGRLGRELWRVFPE